MNQYAEYLQHKAVSTHCYVHQKITIHSIRLKQLTNLKIAQRAGNNPYTWNCVFIHIFQKLSMSALQTMIPLHEQTYL